MLLNCYKFFTGNLFPMPNDSNNNLTNENHLNGGMHMSITRKANSEDDIKKLSCKSDAENKTKRDYVFSYYDNLHIMIPPSSNGRKQDHMSIPLLKTSDWDELSSTENDSSRGSKRYSNRSVSFDKNAQAV